MSWVRGASVVLALCGCDKVLGLEAVDDGPQVTGRTSLVWTTNDATGAPMSVEGTPTAASTSANVRIDGRETNVTIADDGTFAFRVPTPGARYMLSLETQFGSTAYQLNAGALDVASYLVGRPDRKSVPGGTKLVWTVSNRAAIRATAGFVIDQVVSTGLAVFSGGLPATDPIEIDWTAAQSQSGPLGLLEAAQNDGLYYVAYEQLPSGANRAFYVAAEQPFELPGGVTTPLTSTAMPLTLDQCATIAPQIASTSARLGPALPAGAAPAGAVWLIALVPASDQAVYYALVGKQIDAPTPFTDGSETVMYGAPFPGGERVALMIVDWGRTTGGVTVYNSYTIRQPLATGAACPTTTLAADDIAIPSQLTLAGMPLATDGQVVAIDRTTDPVLTWTISSGAVDHYLVRLLEVTGGTLPARWGAHTPISDPVIPVELLKTGHTYIFEVSAEVVTPNFAAGDGRTTSPMFGQARVYSTTFTIQ